MVPLHGNSIPISERWPLNDNDAVEDDDDDCLFLWRGLMVAAVADGGGGCSSYCGLNPLTVELNQYHNLDT